MRKYLLFIISILLIQGCNSSKIEEENKLWENAKNSNKIESFFNFIYENPNTTKIDSSIFYLDILIKSNPLFAYSSVLAVDSVNKRIGIEFVNLNEYDYYLKKRNSYKLTITENGVIHKDSIVTSSTYYKNEIEKLITDPIFGEDYPQTVVKKIKYFGDIVIVKLCVVIDTDCNEIDLGTKLNLKEYIETIITIKNLFEHIWNNKAMEVWESEFQDLSYDNREAIMRLYFPCIELNFVNREFKK